MDVTLYYNSKCSKARSALELLKERGVEPTVIEYLKTPPTREELVRILSMLGLSPRELLRTNEPGYDEAGLSNPTLSDDALIDAMIENPRLIERPIAIVGDRAVIGRPPERVLDLLA